jgi:hypothetical protein
VDLVMVVKSTSVPEETWIARSSGCVFDNGSKNRPIVGSLEINSANWDFNFSAEDRHFITLHEITHTLVFSIVPTYTDNWTVDEVKYSDLTDVAKRDITKDSTFRGTTSKIIVTPTVVEKAREIYGCTTLEGLELEQQGGAGTEGSHWDKRIAREEYMVGDMGIHDPVYSKLTFALLKDSGWYDVLWEWSHPMNWGLGEGCTFISEKCVVGEMPNFNVFCSILDDKT